MVILIIIITILTKNSLIYNIDRSEDKEKPKLYRILDELKDNILKDIKDYINDEIINVIETKTINVRETNILNEIKTQTLNYLRSESIVINDFKTESNVIKK